MATVSSREGVISFTTDTDDYPPSEGSSRIYTIIVHDPGSGSGNLRKVDALGPIVFTYNGGAGVTDAGDYWFDLCGCVSTSGGLYWDSGNNLPVDIYVR
jgi:hypothetical protein